MLSHLLFLDISGLLVCPKLHHYMKKVEVTRAKSLKRTHTTVWAAKLFTLWAAVINSAASVVQLEVRKFHFSRAGAKRGFLDFSYPKH